MIDRCSEWGEELLIVRADVSAAFDSVQYGFLYGALRARVGAEMAFQIMKHMAGCSAEIVWHGAEVGRVSFEKGGQQGSIELPALWNMYVEECLRDVLTAWTRRGEGIRVEHGLGLERGGLVRVHHVTWADDLFLIGRSWQKIQRMLTECAGGLAKGGLSLAPDKLEVLWVRPGGAFRPPLPGWTEMAANSR